MGSRMDGRQAQQLRALQASLGTLSRADGSCRFQMGETAAVASVFGPTEAVAVSRDAVGTVEDRARLAVTYYSGATQTAEEDQHQQQQDQNRDVEAEAAIAGVLEQVILTKLHPRKVIKVSVQVIQDTGSVLACAFLAICGALLDAGIDMIGAPSAACVALNAQGLAIVDPTKMVEEAAVARVFVCTQDDQGEPLIIDSQGPLSRDDFKYCLTQSVSATVACRSFLRITMAEASRKAASNTSSSSTTTTAVSAAP